MNGASIVDSGENYENAPNIEISSNLDGAVSANDIERPFMDNTGSSKHAPMLDAVYRLESLESTFKSTVNFLGTIGLCLCIFLFYAIFLASGSSTSLFLVYALFTGVIFMVLLLLFIRPLRKRRQSQHAPPA
ncbi:hypothetical protein EV426DRAFT_594759 [Tirmania nivea]|nr:hypothetical protein EV426DRAFT_594759 [Tirmania nivea]